MTPRAVEVIYTAGRDMPGNLGKPEDILLTSRTVGAKSLVTKILGKFIFSISYPVSDHWYYLSYIDLIKS